MSEYHVESSYSGQEWTIDNQIRSHQMKIGEFDSGQDVPNPVETLTAAVNSCLSISAAMIIKVHQMDIKNFEVKTTAQTRKLEHGQSDVAAMLINISFDSQMTPAEKEKFIAHVTRVSTVYQTVAKAVNMQIKID